MGYPFWLSDSNLGTRTAGFSLTAQPITLLYGETAGLSCSVQVLNGMLPPGTQLRSSQFGQVQLLGELEGVGTTTSYTFTLRLNNGTNVSDQTFQLQVTESFSEFYWITDNSAPLLYVSDQSVTSIYLQTVTTPLQLVTYACVNLAGLTRGISVEATSGLVKCDLGWQPVTQYQALKDYVFSEGRLYVCAQTGTSASGAGPSQAGANVLDTDYDAWQPSQLYELNQIVTNDVGKVYVCTLTGISANLGGPTGTDTTILDGSCVWQYVTQTVVWNQISPNTQITLSLACVAEIPGASLNRTFDIQLVSTQAEPIWITPAGQIASVLPRTFFTYQLLIEEPDRQAVTWSAVNLPNWLQLSVVGELFGQAPDILSTANYPFTVTVNDGTYTESRTFSVQVSVPQAALTWQTDADLGVVPDGTLSALQVQAQGADVNAAVSYAVTGGVLVPGLQLDAATGSLRGFVEHHAHEKTYVFEITANDSQEQITGKFQVTVQPQNLAHYWTLSLPQLGKTKSELISLNNTSVINDALLYKINEPAWGRTQTPEIIILSGIWEPDLIRLRTLMSDWFRPFQVTLKNITQTDWQTLPYESVAVRVQDAENAPLWQQATTYALNQTVSVSDLNQYQVSQSGTSATQSPQGFTVTDGSVIWQQISSPLQTVNVNHVLPWYAYHVYRQTDTVINQGQLFVCVQAGRSGGNLGPQTDNASDGAVVWQLLNSAIPVSNTYSVNCVTNIREILTQNIPWSTQGGGSGAQAESVVNSVTGAVQQIRVTNSGSGYYQAPVVSILGTGAQAQALAKLGILDAQVVQSGTGVIAGTEFTIDLGEGQPAQLQVTEVTALGQVLQVQVLNPGEFDRVPTQDWQVQFGASVVQLRLNAGVTQVIMQNAGSGYAVNTPILLTGEEYDPVKQALTNQFELVMHLAYVQTGTTTSYPFNPFDNKLLDVVCMKAEVTGIQWQGNTTFDSHVCTWDGAQTSFTEVTPACETVWELNHTVWDAYSTTFDRRLPTTDVLSRTVFDSNATVFDYQAMILDQLPPQYVSNTSAQFLWFMGDHVN